VSVFYRRAVGEHLKIGIAALDVLRDQLGALHSRKLRSFDDPPFEWSISLRLSSIPRSL
jgi:AMP nucleosidase